MVRHGFPFSLKNLSLYFFFCFSISSLGLLAADLQPSDFNKKKKEHFQKWIRLLNSDIWEKREEATQKLKDYLFQHYSLLKPLLDKALLQASAETRWRIHSILYFPLEKIVYLLAKKIAPSGGYGYYEGQFDDLKNIKKIAAPSLIYIISNPDFFKLVQYPTSTSKYGKYLYLQKQKDYQIDYKIRYLALMAVGDLNIQESKKALITIFKKDKSLQDTAASSLYKLGEKKYLNQMITALEQKAATQPVLSHQLRIYADLAHLYRSIGRFDKTIEYYKKALTYRQDPILYYNLACAYSSAKKAKKAVEALKKAVKAGYRDYSWMLMDGDLGFIKKHPKFLQLIQDLQKKYP